MRSSECAGHGWVAFTQTQNKTWIPFWLFSGTLMRWLRWKHRRQKSCFARCQSCQQKKKKSAEMFSRPYRCRISQLHRQPLIHSILVLVTLQWFISVGVGLKSFLPPDIYSVFWLIAFMRALFLDQNISVNNTRSFFELCSCFKWSALMRTRAGAAWAATTCSHLARCIAKVWINQRQLPYQSPPLVRLQH